MGLKVGIVGLPNVGKSTLFSAITNSTALIANYPFATIEPNIGIVKLLDKRLEQLAQIAKPNKVINAVFEFIDIAGLVKGASQGEGLGNKFLANIREVDAIIQVVRCFENKDILHVSEKINPIDDIEVINLELILADLETVNNALLKLNRKINPDLKVKNPIEILNQVKKHLEQNLLVRNLDLSFEAQDFLKSYHFLTLKPVLYVGNISESMLKAPDKFPYFKMLKDFANQDQTPVLSICAQVEYDLNTLDQADRALFLSDLNIEEPGLNVLIRESFKLLNLRTFFTVGVEEVRAWIFKQNMTAPECAGVIHSDFEKGFIRAEVISFDDFINNQGYNGSKVSGKIRLEGKNYLVNDGDIVHFRFNV